MQLWYQGEARELGSEQATLATRAATIEAANNVREREREVNHKVISAVIERKLEHKYAAALETLREERDAHVHANGSLRQQLQEAQDIQLQMHATLKRYEEDAQKAVDDVAAQARAREAELRASLQFGAFDPLRHGAQAPADPALEQQLKQALADVEGARQDLANWKDDVEY